MVVMRLVGVSATQVYSTTAVDDDNSAVIVLGSGSRSSSPRAASAQHPGGLGLGLANVHR